MQDVQQARSSLDDVLSPEMLRKAPHLEELDRKRALLEKIRATADAVMLNRGAVEHPPNIAVCWVNVNNERQLWYQGMDWRKVNAADTDIHTQYQQPDGTHVRGDLILYCRDAEYDEVYHLSRVLKGIEQIEGHKQAFEIEAQKSGVPTFRPKV